MRNLILATTAAPALILTLAASPALSAGLEIDVTGQANGTITIDLFEDVAPLHAAQITALAAAGAYDGVVFHRVIDGFMAQTGDVQFGRAGGDLSTAGMGGSDLPDIPLEVSDIPFTPGIIGMARASDPNSANSQFFIMFTEYPSLNGEYTVVGKVTSGMEVVDAIRRRDPGMGGEADMMTAVRVTP